MKKRNYVKQVAVGLSMLMVISLAGCAGNVEDNKKATTDTTAETTTEVTATKITENTTKEITTEIQTEETTEEQTTEEIEIVIDLENIDFMTTEGYLPSGEVEEDYDFLYEEVGDYNVYTGEYALDGNEKYEIIVRVADDYMDESYIEINGKTLELSDASHGRKVRIIDVDTTDKYKEVAIYDDGPSGDPSILVVRYDGKEIYELGKFGGMYDRILFDGKGKVMDESCYISFVAPNVVRTYYELSGNKFEAVNVDYENALDTVLTVSRGISVAFGESDDTNIKNAYNYIESLDDTIRLNRGDKIKLFIWGEYELYYIQMPDGRIGYITTHLAG